MAAAPVQRTLAMPAALTAQGFALRPETEADVPFLRRLYISTRWEELAPVVDWTDAQKIAFLESQFALQRHHYRTYYAASEFAVLDKDGVPAGRIYIDRQATAAGRHRHCAAAGMARPRRRHSADAGGRAPRRARPARRSVSAWRNSIRRSTCTGGSASARSPTKASIGSWNGRADEAPAAEVS